MNAVMSLAREVVLKIKVTVMPEDHDPDHYFVKLEKDLDILTRPKDEKAGRKVVWTFCDVPDNFTPTIVPVCFEPAPGHKHVYFRPFKEFVLDGNTISATPHASAGGTCWYEVVLVPRPNVREHRRRLYCTTREMGGIDIEPPPL